MFLFFLKKIKTVFSLFKTWHLQLISISENSIKAKDSKKRPSSTKKKAQATDYTDLGKVVELSFFQNNYLINFAAKYEIYSRTDIGNLS